MGEERGRVRDYERIAALGVKRMSDLAREASASAALGRLLERGLAAEEHGAVVLRRPEDWPTPPDGPLSARMRARYREWLRADGRGRGAEPEFDDDGDELLYGELGFWQHWWNRIRERDQALGPLSMDIVVPDDGVFEARAWLAEFDPGIRSHVLGAGLLRGRAIVPPPALGSAVEPMLDLSAESGIEVRVLSTEARFVLYDERVAVLHEPPGEGEEGTERGPEPCWAVRRRAVVDPLRQFFELLWRSATPFRARRGDHRETLELLARGFTDARIAAELGVSPRTVSRRVSGLLAEYGAGSRFELGAMYGRHRPDP